MVTTLTKSFIHELPEKPVTAFLLKDIVNISQLVTSRIDPVNPPDDGGRYGGSVFHELIVNDMQDPLSCDIWIIH
jgi:hypothetical protein